MFTEFFLMAKYYIYGIRFQVLHQKEKEKY